MLVLCLVAAAQTLVKPSLSRSFPLADNRSHHLSDRSAAGSREIWRLSGLNLGHVPSTRVRQRHCELLVSIVVFWAWYFGI